jgi:hypothetical protein
MKRFGRLGIRHRLYAAFILMTALMVGLGVVSLTNGAPARPAPPGSSSGS